MLFVFEFDYMTEVSSKVFAGACSRDFMKQLSCCKRYIDDLWNPTVPEFDKVWPEIYPDYLPLNKEAEGPQVDYLDMSIWCDSEDRRWHSKLYDKRVGLVKKGLKLNKFPHPDSCLTRQCKYGVIGSQLSRLSVANSQNKHFLQSAVSLYFDFYNKNYDPRMMNKYFSKFLRRNRISLHLRTDAVTRRFRFIMASSKYIDETVQKARHKFRHAPF